MEELGYGQHRTGGKWEGQGDHRASVGLGEDKVGCWKHWSE